MEDRGLDSVADLRILTRVLVGGAVAVIAFGLVAAVVGGRWYLLALVVVPYAVIATSQWVIAERRLRRGDEAPGRATPQ